MLNFLQILSCLQQLYISFRYLPLHTTHCSSFYMILLLATFLDFTTNFLQQFFFSVYLLFLSHKAIECGDVSAVKQWLEEEETRVNDCKGGSASHGHFFVGDGTALHWAAYYGQLEIAKLLLNNGAGMSTVEPL